MNRLARHEYFQKQVADRLSKIPGVVPLSASTTAPCDLVVLNPMGYPICLEIKTVGFGTTKKRLNGQLSTAQKAFRARLEGPEGIGAHFAVVTRSWGMDGARVTVNSTNVVIKAWLEEHLAA